MYTTQISFMLSRVANYAFSLFLNVAVSFNNSFELLLSAIQQETNDWAQSCLIYYLMIY